MWKNKILKFASQNQISMTIFVFKQLYEHFNWAKKQTIDQITLKKTDILTSMTTTSSRKFQQKQTKSHWSRSKER